MRILCIEDNDDSLFVLYRRLTRAGFEVTVVTDGAQGVDTAIASPPDMILMDLNLPGLDGWEATRRLKGRPETTAVPIIAVSAHAAAGRRGRREAGAGDQACPTSSDRRAGSMPSSSMAALKRRSGGSSKITSRLAGTVSHAF